MELLDMTEIRKSSEQITHLEVENAKLRQANTILRASIRNQVSACWPCSHSTEAQFVGVVQRLKAAQVPSSHLLTVTRGVVRAHMLLVQAVRRFRRRRQGVTYRPEIALLTRRVLFRALGCSRVCTNGNRANAGTRNRDSIGNSCAGSAGVPPIAAAAECIVAAFTSSTVRNSDSCPAYDRSSVSDSSDRSSVS
jgi:hypothetical protein